MPKHHVTRQIHAQRCDLPNYKLLISSSTERRRLTVRKKPRQHSSERELRKSSSERSKPARRPRIPSVDDSAILDYQVKIRQKSIESSTSSKSKNDMDIQMKNASGSRRRTRTASIMDQVSMIGVADRGERGKHAESFLGSKGIPTIPFETDKETLFQLIQPCSCQG